MKIKETVTVVEVEDGDTLGSIAQLVFGGDWRGLYHLNEATILAEQQRRGIRPECIPRIIRGSDRSPPAAAHLIYPGTLLRVI